MARSREQHRAGLAWRGCVVLLGLAGLAAGALVLDGAPAASGHYGWWPANTRPNRTPRPRHRSRACRLPRRAPTLASTKSTTVSTSSTTVPSSTSTTVPSRVVPTTIDSTVPRRHSPSSGRPKRDPRPRRPSRRSPRPPPLRPLQPRQPRPPHRLPLPDRGRGRAVRLGRAIGDRATFTRFNGGLNHVGSGIGRSFGCRLVGGVDSGGERRVEIRTGLDQHGPARGARRDAHAARRVDGDRDCGGGPASEHGARSDRRRPAS